jgi:hypothetical protein
MSDFNILEDEFPLFDNLYSQFKDETEFKEIHGLILLLRNLDQTGLNILVLLIKKYSLITSSKEETPFSGKECDNGEVKFDIRNFDVVLQHMLLEFCKRHLEKVQTH